MKLKSIKIQIIGIFNLFLLNAAATAQSTNFFFDDWEAKDFSAGDFELKEGPSGLPDAMVIVDLNTEINKISPYIYGNNSVIWATRLYDQSKFVKQVADLNPHILRFPGGNLSNDYFWNATPDLRPSDIPPDLNYWAGKNTPDWSMSLDDYYKLLDSTNTTGIICVNYGYARYGLSNEPVLQAAHYAADWVRYDNGRTTFWEIGNENYGNWESGYEIDTDLNKDGQPKTITGKLYGQHFNIFADSMRSAASSIGYEIKIGAVAMESEVTYDQVMQNWNQSMMQETGNTADFYIVHSYYTPYRENSSPAVILNSAGKTASYQEYVWDGLQNAGFDKVPVALTEWNIFAEGGSQQISNINGLHAVLVLGQLMNNGYGLATRWDLVNGWDNGNDHGMFSYGGEPGVPVWNPRPVFYYMYYFQKFTGDRAVQAVVEDNPDIETFASLFQSGQAGVMIVNKSAEKKIAKIKINDHGFDGYYYYSLAGGDDNPPFSKKVTVNGNITPYDAGGPTNYTEIKPYGKKEYSGSVKVEVNGYGAVFLVAEVSNQVTGLDDEPGSELRIYPNPSSNVIHFVNPRPVNSVRLLDLNGKEICSNKFNPPLSEGNLTTHLHGGFYILQVSGKDYSICKIIIIK